MKQPQMKIFRAKSCITQEQLAEKLGVTSRTIICWENGTVKMKLYQLDAVWRALTETD